MMPDKVKLADIARMRTGKLDSNAAVEDGEYPFFTCSQQTLRIDQPAYDTEAVLFGGNNAAGVFPLKYYQGQFNAYQRTYIIETLDPNVLNTRYLYYALRPALSHFQSASIGAATQYLTKGILDNFRVTLPSIGTQNHIVDTLSAYDDLIENNRRRIQLLEQAARLLYKEWFVHLRFPGHEHTQIIDGVPEGWEDTLLPDVIDVNPKTPVEKGKEILYVPMSALSEAGMTTNTADFERRTTHTAVKFKKSDVLLARITPCLENGKTGYVYFLGDDEVACGSTEFIVLRGKRVSPAFTYCLARSYPFRGNAIKSMIGSSGRQRVQVSCFDEYKVPLPHKHLLEMFDDIANTAFDQIRVLVAQNDKLTKARDLLLPKLMNGEVAV